MSVLLPIDITEIKGFLADDEAEALYLHAQQSSNLGPIFEIGSYCGKSTIYLGAAVKANNGIVFALDHHRGSEEHQLGEEYHDGELYDSSVELMDTFKEFRKNMRAADLEDTVVPVVSSSLTASRHWSTTLCWIAIITALLLVFRQRRLCRW